jgi:hypothetical protein
VAKRRARLNDENDPLSSTDKVLAGFEQLSQSTSQPDDKLTCQQVSLSATQPDDKLTCQQVSLSAIRKATLRSYLARRVHLHLAGSSNATHGRRPHTTLCGYVRGLQSGHRQRTPSAQRN